MILGILLICIAWLVKMPLWLSVLITIYASFRISIFAGIELAKILKAIKE